MSFWSIFKNISIENIFKKNKPTTISNIDPKKDDDYDYKHHLAVMEEINKYKKYNLQSLSDSEIRIIAENIYSLAKDSGEIYYKSNMFNEEFREIKNEVLLQDIRIRRELFELICEVGESYKFEGLFELERLINRANSEVIRRYNLPILRTYDER